MAVTCKTICSEERRARTEKMTVSINNDLMLLQDEEMEDKLVSNGCEYDTTTANTTKERNFVI